MTAAAIPPAIMPVLVVALTVAGALVVALAATEAWERVAVWNVTSVERRVVPN